MMRIRDIRRAVAGYNENSEVVIIEMFDGSYDFCVKEAMSGRLFSSDDFEMVEDTIEDDYDECGFDPYEGCYTYDC